MCVLLGLVCCLTTCNKSHIALLPWTSILHILCLYQILFWNIWSRNAIAVIEHTLTKLDQRPPAARVHIVTTHAYTPTINRVKDSIWNRHSLLDKGEIKKKLPKCIRCAILHAQLKKVLCVLVNLLSYCMCASLACIHLHGLTFFLHQYICICLLWY